MVALSEFAAEGLPELLLVSAGPDAEGRLRQRLQDQRLTATLLDRMAEAGFREALALVVGDRCELYVTSRDSATDGSRLEAVLASVADVPVDALRSGFSRRAGSAAVAHLFGLAAMPDTAGETHLLEQLRFAHRLSADRGLVGDELEAALQAAYAVANRLRMEAPLGGQPLSMAATAVQTARDLHGTLGGVAALLIGSGEMGQLLADELRRAGLGELTVMHPALARAELMARQHRCHFRPWEELDAALAGADIVLSALGMGREVVSADAVRRALKQRRLRPILLMDLSVPSDIERAAGELADAFRYDVDDLERIAMRERGPQAKATSTGHAILDAELAAFAARRADRESAPALEALREILEAERAQALAVAGGDAERATRLLVDGLLARPASRLKELAAGRGREAERSELLALVRCFFGEASE